MFNSDNYSFTGFTINYDALNQILVSRLPVDYDEQDEKNESDKINNEMIDRDGKLYVGDVCVAEECSDNHKDGV